MLTLEKAVTPPEFDELLDLISNQHSTCLRSLFDWVELNRADFGDYFRRTGSAFRIIRDGSLTGLCWIERSRQDLVIRGIVIRPEFQGEGVGTWALGAVERRYRRWIRTITLEVHASNPRAKALYHRMGFTPVDFDPFTGFYTMKKECRGILVGDSHRPLTVSAG